MKSEVKTNRTPELTTKPGFQVAAAAAAADFLFWKRQVFPAEWCSKHIRLEFRRISCPRSAMDMTCITVLRQEYAKGPF